ncbi:MAG: PD-(D/E)XK nuclease family protein [Candidatus Schekmanbacteria bacterium]|nr:PD-(D/E)XK nuclease family protein [Candidatus Schekmanbacteria bacterium]
METRTLSRPAGAVALLGRLTREALARFRQLTGHEEVRTRFSRLDTYRQCPAKYQYRYVERAVDRAQSDAGREVSPHLSFDRSLHDVLEQFHRRQIHAGQAPDLGWMLERLEQVWIRRDYDDAWRREQACGDRDAVGPEEAAFKQNAQDALARYHAWWSTAGLMPYTANKTTRLILGRVIVNATLDLVAYDRDGRFHVFDFKTGKRVRDPADIPHDLGAGIQYLASRDLPRVGGLVDSFSFYFLQAGRRVCGSFDLANLESTRAEIRGLVRRIEDGDFAATCGWWCRRCEFRGRCEAWKAAPSTVLAPRTSADVKPRLRLSYSKMSLFDRCPRAYKKVYVEGVRQKPKPFFSFGSCIHATFEELYCWDGIGRRPSWRTLRRMFHETWKLHRLGYANPEEEEKYFKEGLDMLRKYYQRFVAGQPFRKAEAIEAFFELPIGRRGLMNGYIDRIDLLPDGTREVIDYKTEPTRRTQEQVDKDMQLTTYFWACREAFGYSPSKLSLFMLYHDEKLTTQRTDRDVEGLVAFVDGVCARMEAEVEYAPKMNKYCRSCDFLHDCPQREAVLSNSGLRSMEFD